MLRFAIAHHTLRFRFEAGTSRGILRTKPSWFVKVWLEGQPERFGIGECSILPKLAIDDRADFAERLKGYCQLLMDENGPDKIYSLPGIDAFPSIITGLEMAIWDMLNGGVRHTFVNGFSEGDPLEINGLVWMGDRDFMLEQIREKIARGFRCIKLKVGAIDFEQECALLAYIREHYTSEQITIRVDANGAFSEADVLPKLHKLAAYELHSIEQPVRAGQYKLMQEVCAKSPLRVALDEELINIHSLEQRQTMLTKVRPHYIVLKPSLIGGFQSSTHWIKTASALGMGWWITSALESDVGLNAIAHFTAELKPDMPQGLGTGQLFENNIPSPLEVANGYLRSVVGKNWDFSQLEFEVVD